MKKEWLLTIGSATLTLLIALALVRWLAPGLLGIFPDLQLVQVSKEIPPFYDNIFRQEDHRIRKFIINDPITIQRAQPLFPDVFFMGPNDILGFRNMAVPNVADIITIGDSQTYGNNAVLRENWPNRIKVHLADKSPVVYNMSSGAWNGVQYLEIFSKALFFKPRVVVVAFYTGNDALGAFTIAYGSEHWKSFRLNPKLTKADVPKVDYPPPKSELWPVRFKDGTTTVFTPQLRLASNRLDDPAVKAGYAILKEVGQQICSLAHKKNIPVVFTIIPTKELVYAERIRHEGIDPPGDYQTLVKSEKKYLSSLAGQLSTLQNAEYVDLLTPLQQAAEALLLYSSNDNGHPAPAGYDVIAKTLAPALRAHLPPVPKGLMTLDEGGGHRTPIFVNDEGVWRLASKEPLLENGAQSSDTIRRIKHRDIAGLPRMPYKLVLKVNGPND